MPPSAPILTVIMVSYNTRDLTLAALRTLIDTTLETPIHVTVLDNASTDGSADAVAEAFPEVELIRSAENLGFARANNVVAEKATTDWLLLLNPDTECLPGAVDNLMAFARARPQAGIWGGRTVFADGSLNPTSCANRITPWSMICRTTGLYSVFSGSEVFNPEAIGGWPRDTVREVDIVVGCFFLIRRETWDALGGFDAKYFMYGEETDLCLRAARMGLRPAVTPDAQIVHLTGAATKQKADRIVKVARARASLIRDHWPAWQAPFGIGLMWAGTGGRALVARLAGAMLGGRWRNAAETHGQVWAARDVWLRGYAG